MTEPSVDIGRRRPAHHQDVVDLADDAARVAMPAKWGMVTPDVVPAWVAETDYALAPPIAAALARVVALGVAGYPAERYDPELGVAYSGFAERQFGHHIDPVAVIQTADVTAGVRLAIEALSGPGPVILPLPGYPPHHALGEATGRRQIHVVLSPDAVRAELDLDQLEALLTGGGRTLILTQPHNPWGRVFSRAELEGIRDLVLRHDARVVSDEIHAPMVLDVGRPFHSYLSIEGTEAHAVAVTSASKAFNTPGLRCAQIICPDPVTRRRLLHMPKVYNDSWSPIGTAAAIAAYSDGDDWLRGLRRRLASQRDLLVSLLAETMPTARMRPIEAGFLAWIDLRGYGVDDPAAVALERGRVRLVPGHDFQPGLTGHVRLNFATSRARLTTIVARLATALDGSS